MNFHHSDTYIVIQAMRRTNDQILALRNGHLKRKTDRSNSQIDYKQKRTPQDENAILIDPTAMLRKIVFLRSVRNIGGKIKTSGARLESFSGFWNSSTSEEVENLKAFLLPKGRLV